MKIWDQKLSVIGVKASAVIVPYDQYWRQVAAVDESCWINSVQTRWLRAPAAEHQHQRQRSTSVQYYYA